MKKENIICFAIDTTGPNPIQDEILHLSVLDGNEEVVFDEFIKPDHHAEWPDAAMFTGITPDTVASKKSIKDYLPQLQDIIDRAELVVGYNCDSFGLAFLEQAGLIVDTPTYDVMREFMPIYGQIDDEAGGYKRQSLQTCAEYYGIDRHFWIDSTERATDTLHCFYGTLRDRKWDIRKEEIFEPTTMTAVLVEPGKPGQVVEIDRGLESLQAAVDGYIEAMYPFDEPVALIANEEGKIQNLSMNRAIYNENGKAYDIIHGTFLITGLERNNFGSLTPEQASRYEKLFESPDIFWMSEKQIDPPDPTITIEEMQKYGYSWDGMLPLRKEAAIWLFENADIEILCLYDNNSESLIHSYDEIQNHAERGGIFGVTNEEWHGLILSDAMRKNYEKIWIQDLPTTIDPRNNLVGEWIKTPRGSFPLTNLSLEKMQAAGYCVHHSSIDGKHLIMSNGTSSFAVRKTDLPKQAAKTTAPTAAQDSLKPGGIKL